MTDFKIHFRGVALMVANPPHNNRIMEVLFPRTNEKPRDGREGKVQQHDASSDNPGKPIDVTVRRHADGGPARLHFAGAAVIGPGKVATYHDLLGRDVTLGSGGKGGAPMNVTPQQASFLNTIFVPGKELKLLANRDDPSRVATRFYLDGGALIADCPSAVGWKFESKHGSTTDAEQYCLDCVWTVPAGNTLEFIVGKLGVGGEVERITLDATHTEVYFYNFDIPMPTHGQLTSETIGTGIETDEDFKWLYQLLENDGHQPWPAWLGKKNVFPAPVHIPPLVDVSTCFWTIWTGASE